MNADQNRSGGGGRRRGEERDNRRRGRGHQRPGVHPVLVRPGHGHHDGSKQATYDGHPLYTYTADTAPGQAKGNNINLNGGIWHEITVSS